MPHDAAEVDVGDKLAQPGSRLIDSTAEKLAGAANSCKLKSASAFPSF
jgi:carbon monoxide dehydrogenase subunit G